MTGLGEVRWVLDMLLERDRPRRTISISQEAFIDSILTRFNLTDATTVATSLPLELTFPRTTVLTRRTKLRRWRISRIGSLQELLRDSHSELVRTLGPPPVRSPKMGTTRSRPLGRGQTSITLPQGHRTVASRAGRQVPAGRRLHRLRRPTLNRSVSQEDRRWGRQLEVQEGVFRRALVDGSGVHGALPSGKGIGMGGRFSSYSVCSSPTESLSPVLVLLC